MKKRKTIFMLFILLTFFCLYCGCESPTAPEAETLDEFINNRMEQARIPGLAAAIVANGEVAWTAGYGFANIEAQRAVTPETAFGLGSVSKTVLAVALMQVWEKGALSLDSNINDMLPFTVDNPHVAGEIITPRHLATHTSSILDNGPVYADSYVFTGDSPIALGDFLNGYLVPGGVWYDATRNYASSAPGEKWSYSNLGAGLAGYLIETTTGIPLDDHSDAHIFGPLGLINTGWRLSDFSSKENIAVPYELNSQTFQPFPFYGFHTWPDGGLRASVADLARFLAAIINGGELDGVRILNESTVQEMLSSQIPELGESQGIFWDIDGDRNGHNGGDPGVNTSMFFKPTSGVGVIVLMNISPNLSNVRALIAIRERLFERGFEFTGGGSG